MKQINCWNQTFRIRSSRIFSLFYAWLVCTVYLIRYMKCDQNTCINFLRQTAFQIFLWHKHLTIEYVGNSRHYLCVTWTICYNFHKQAVCLHLFKLSTWTYFIAVGYTLGCLTVNRWSLLLLHTRRIWFSTSVTICITLRLWDLTLTTLFYSVRNLFSCEKCSMCVDRGSNSGILPLNYRWLLRYNCTLPFRILIPAIVFKIYTACHKINSLFYAFI